MFRRRGVLTAVVRLITGESMRKLGVIPAVVMAFSLASLPVPAAAVEVGDKAPDFELFSTKGGKFKLSEMAGKKHVVIQFYVIDFTPT
jgi:hypothetical protein